jgi:SH3-like domain-containing protein
MKSARWAAAATVLLWAAGSTIAVADRAAQPPMHRPGSSMESDLTPEPALAAPPPAAPRPAKRPSAEAGEETGPALPTDPGRGSITNLPLPRYVSLKGREGNARRGPGLTNRIDWVFTRAGMPLRITAEYEHWRRVEDSDGAGGWVHYSLLSGVRSVLVTQAMAEFHSAPRDEADVVFKAEQNVVGWLQECQPDWCRVAVEGEKGWVRKTALWGVDPGEVVE